ncbi:protein FRA10AC1 homolog isoform X2 [Acanthaster planci]|uniref:Protein FRA10AC1 homolog isoform X2 n=1 Tax=Acanthaster planci TaxID=133434 RepID=A0A8B7YTB8_ACAPL|nr:protein FRA10AC1 homolog isoform X2 [Acanthaster planci]
MSQLQFGYNGGDYGSEFEFDEDQDRRKRARYDLATKSRPSAAAVPSKRLVQTEYSREEGKAQRFHFLALNAYGRHKELVNNYLLYYPGAKEQLFKRNTVNDKTDLDVIRENHQFLWEPKDEVETSWAKRLAKRYWDKLFKEYCIADLSRYKENKIALRWRVEKEVVEGKGHFSCGNKRCTECEGLRSWEVNFAYVEHGDKKNALVKLRLCPECSYKLNYHHKRRDVTRQPTKRPSSREVRENSPKGKRSKRKSKQKEKHKHKKPHKKKRKESSSSSSSEEEDDGEPSGRKAQDEAGSSDVSDSKFWSGPAPIVEDKSREEEFEDYFQDMFL